MNTATRETLMSSGKDDWETPQDLFDQLHQEFGFTLDVAANAANHKRDAWYGPDHHLAVFRDGLAMPWIGVCWCNPPYSRGLQAKFIAKAAEEASRGGVIVMLLPARTDTKAFHRYIWDATWHAPRGGVQVRFLPGRLRFVGAADAAPFPSMVVIFGGRRG